MTQKIGLFFSIFFLMVADAQAGLHEGSVAYRNGHFSAALKELMPLAEQGNAQAQELIGEMHGSGSGVVQDNVQAALWYRRAALQGNVQAQTALGVMYEKGIGVPQDNQEALSWYYKAAEQGYGEALYSLGGIYERGQGAADLLEAYKWFNLAVAAGFEIAQDNLVEIEARMSYEQTEQAQSMTKEWLARLPGYPKDNDSIHTR